MYENDVELLVLKVGIVVKDEHPLNMDVKLVALLVSYVGIVEIPVQLARNEANVVPAVVVRVGAVVRLVHPFIIDVKVVPLLVLSAGTVVNDEHEA